MLDNGQAWLSTNKRDRDLLNTDADSVAKYMCSYTPQPLLLQPATAPVSQELRAEEEAVTRLRVQLRMAEEAAALSWPGMQPQQQGRCTSIVEGPLRRGCPCGPAAPEAACSGLLSGRCPHRVAAEERLGGPCLPPRPYAHWPQASPRPPRGRACSRTPACWLRGGP